MHKKMKQILATAALAALTTTIAAPVARADGGAPAPQNPPVAAPAPPAAPAAPVTSAGATVTTSLYGANGTPADPTANLPAVSVTPGSLFYSLKLFFEKLDLFFTLSTTNKAQALLDQAQVRLAEAKAAVSAGDQAAASQAMERYNATMSEAARLTKQAADAHKDITKLETKVESTKPAWAQLLAELIAATPEADRQQLVEKIAPALLEMSKVEAAGKQATKPETTKPEAAKAETQPQPPLDQEALKKLEADQAALALQLQAAGVEPKTLLVLINLSEHSHKHLAQVYALSLQNADLNRLATLLGVSTKDAAAKETAKAAPVDVKATPVPVKIQSVEVTSPSQAAPAKAVQVQVQAKTPVAVQPKVIVIYHGDDENQDHQDEHRKSKGEQGRGQQQGQHGDGHGQHED